MIKVISNSDILSTWYLDPGIPFGDGTQEHPYYWDAVCDEERTGISGTVSSSSHQYYKILLKSGTTYTFRYNKDGSWDGDMRISFYDSDGTAVRDSWDSDPIEQFDYTPTKNGLCTLRIQPYSSYSGSFKYLVTPAPEQFVGNPGWKKKTGLVAGSGWNIKTGKLFKYRSIENAGIKFNDFPKDGLILYYNMDDDNSTCVDTVNGYNMTIQAGSGLTYGNDGKFGKCWESTGYSYLKCNTAPNITDTFSINLWMYKTVNTGGPNSTIFELGTHASNTGFGFYLSGSNITWRLNQLYQYYVSDVIPLNEWIMLSYTFDGNYCRVYKNANIIIETSNTQKPNLSNVIVAFARSDSSTSEDYRGKLDEIGVWNRALSLEELNKLYNNNKGSIFK